MYDSKMSLSGAFVVFVGGHWEKVSGRWYIDQYGALAFIVETRDLLENDPTLDET